MAGKQNDSPNPQMEKPHKEFFHTLWKSILERYPELKPWDDWFKRAWKGMQKSLILFLLLIGLPLVGVTIFTTSEIKTHYQDALLSTTNAFFRSIIDATNSFFGGQIAQLNKDVNKFQRDYEAVRQERDKAQEELAPWIELANSQQITNGPLSKRLDKLFERVEPLTNLLNEISFERPSFDLYLNNVRAANGMTISLEKSRKLKICIRNLSEVTADKVAVDFIAPKELEKTNLIYDGWMVEPPSLAMVNDEVTEIVTGYHWRSAADNPLPSFQVYDAPSLEISTNFSYKVIPVEFDISAVKSKNQKYLITLAFSQ